MQTTTTRNTSCYSIKRDLFSICEWYYDISCGVILHSENISQKFRTVQEIVVDESNFDVVFQIIISHQVLVTSTQDL